jgi:hypothetical protein
MAHYNIRDLLGHWVSPKSRRQKMCPHACCRNYRVHPANMPVILPNRLLRRASEEDLREHYKRVSRGDTDQDIQARYQVLAEMDRRDQADIRRHQSELRRKEQIFGRKLAREEAVETAWQAAERDTKGNMLNRAGKAAGISERSLFTGPESRARRYASEELLNHWQHNPRPTAAMFRGEDTTLGARGSSAPPRRHYGTVSRRTITSGTGRAKRTVNVAVVRKDRAA